MHTGTVTKPLTFPKSKNHMCYREEKHVILIFNIMAVPGELLLTFASVSCLSYTKNDVCNYGDVSCHEDGDR